MSSGRQERAELEQAIDRENRRSGALSTLHNHACAAAVGIHPTDWQAIDVLDAVGPLAAGELARRLGLSSGAATGVIDRLERQGFVARVRDPADRRKVVVELDPDGWPGVALPFDALLHDVEALLARFDDGELGAVAAFLAGMNDAIERSIERMRDAADRPGGPG